METTDYLIKRLRYHAHYSSSSNAQMEELLEAAERLEELQNLEVDFNESLHLACEANKDLQARIVQLELELRGEEE